MSLMCARVRPRSVAELGRRESDRHVTNLEVLARPLDTSDVISWGATVRDISSNGIGLNLCYPFPPGTYLAVDLYGRAGGLRTLLARVVHAVDLPNGTWHVGCEFLKPLSDSELELVV